jgi:hypothetical protein
MFDEAAIFVKALKDPAKRPAVFSKQRLFDQTTNPGNEVDHPALAPREVSLPVNLGEQSLLVFGVHDFPNLIARAHLAELVPEFQGKFTPSADYETVQAVYGAVDIEIKAVGHRFRHRSYRTEVVPNFAN